MLVGGLLILVAGLMAFFPSMNSSGETDWISIPLVGFPIVVSCILLAFASQEKRSRKEIIASPIRLFTLLNSQPSAAFMSTL